MCVWKAAETKDSSSSRFLGLDGFRTVCLIVSFDASARSIETQFNLRLGSRVLFSRRSLLFSCSRCLPKRDSFPLEIYFHRPRSKRRSKIDGIKIEKWNLSRVYRRSSFRFPPSERDHFRSMIKLAQRRDFAVNFLPFFRFLLEISQSRNGKKEREREKFERPQNSRKFLSRNSHEEEEEEKESTSIVLVALFSV